MAVGGPKAPAQQPDAVQLAEPLAVRHIALPARHVLDVPRVDEEDLEARAPRGSRRSGSSRRPWLPSPRWSRHRRPASPRAGADRSVNVVNDWTGVRTPIRRHRDVVLGGPAIDPGGIRVDALQHRRRQARLPGRRRRLSFIGGSSILRWSIREQGDGIGTFSQTGSRACRPRVSPVTLPYDSPGHAHRRADPHQWRVGLGSRMRV